MNIAVIPARGGSKRIPRKNVRPFCDKPIIAYSIEAALQSNLFSSVLVSTDDEEIADVARSFGAEAPFKRPASLSDDYTGTTPVIRHALKWCLNNDRPVNTVCGIYATAPFVTTDDILKGFDAIQSSQAAFTVTTFPYPILRSLRRGDDSRLSLIWPEHRTARSQDLEETYHDCGQIYWGTKEFMLSEKEFTDGDAVGIYVPRCRVQDIDTEEDWIRAEAMYQVLKETGQL